MVGIGGLFIMGGGYFPGTIPQTLGALSVLFASVNVAGGFVITKPMLDMFKRESPVRKGSECSFYFRANGSTRVFLVIWYPCRRIHRRILSCHQHWDGRARASRIPD